MAGGSSVMVDDGGAVVVAMGAVGAGGTCGGCGDTGRGMATAERRGAPNS